MSPQETDSASAAGSWRVLQIALLIFAGGAFLFELRALLNPFILYCVFMVLLMPFRGVRGHARLVTVSTVLLVLWVLATAGSLLAPFFLALVLAYILDPLTDRISAHPRIGRSGAILIFLVPFLALGAIVFVFGIPELVRQGRMLVAEAPLVVDELVSWVQGISPQAPGFDLPLVDDAAIVSWIQGLDAAAVSEFLESRREALMQQAWEAVLGLGRGVATLATVIGYLILTPILTFYLLRDYDRMVARISELLPGRARREVGELARDYDTLLARYLRGQVAASLITGAITWMGLLLTGFPYALLLGAIVAVLGVIPYLGLVVSLIPAIIIALVSGDVGVSLIKVAVVYGVAQGLESAVISPRIVGDSVGLHPVWILLALSLGGLYFGFVGLLIGVPLAVAAKLFLARGLARYRNSALYKEGALHV